MTTAPTPPDEAIRLAALRELEILDSREGERFGRIIRLARHFFDVPVAGISLVESDREWFLACDGMESRENPRAQSFCAHTILDEDTLVVSDATSDPRFAENAMVREAPGLRFYAGHPIRAPNGSRIGAMSIRDYRPRSLSATDLEVLKDLARWAEDEIRVGTVSRLEHEIQERTAAQQHAEKLYRKFIDLSIDLLCIADFNGYFRGLSPSWEWVTGYSMEELKARPFIEFVHPDDREVTEREAGRITEGAVTIDFENRYICKDGGIRWLYWTAVPDREEERIYAVARDMTERREFEEELRRAKDEAEFASHAKSDFLAAMSHELRTPLNSVIGFSNVILAERKAALGSKQKDYVERIRSNGEHLLELINDVLDLSRIEAGRVEVSWEQVEIGNLITDVMAQFEPQVADVPTRLLIDVPDDAKVVITDPRMVRQILINLVANAVKFTPEGSVTVRLRVGESGAPKTLEVEDTGIGIPQDRLEKVFESFEQVDSGIARTFQGTGLGLSICRSLCGLLGYTLTVESTVGKGSVFRLALRDPGLEAATERRKSDSQSIPRDMVRRIEAVEQEGVTFADKLVLVIDDDPDSRLILTQCLHEMGCQVLTATSARQGQRMAHDHLPDLITLDLLMPGTNGWQVLARFKEDERLRDTPVIVVSSVASEHRHGVIGASEILDKPVDPGALKRALERNLAVEQRCILVVDDNADDRELIASYLGNGGTEVWLAAGAEEALSLLEKTVPDLAIIDLLMPGMDGAELITEMRQRKSLRDLPVLVVTAKDLDRDELERLSRASAAVVLKGPGLRGDLNEVCWKLWRLRSEAGAHESDG